MEDKKSLIRNLAISGIVIAGYGLYKRSQTTKPVDLTYSNSQSAIGIGLAFGVSALLIYWEK